ncbi:hypothetical protein AB0E75_06065 [Streptomyces griseoviridis]|uniref:Uncharacterized protein n=2 Tax=Streptomyces TaxID=1883 RepID=A0A918LGJ1_STRGD|nr:MULTISPECIES: hypothetical protein [Streptomyces]GGS43685.1 hypothetical protein GCM10010238_36790 [Streptomyces niveoruber]GGU14578.1 hypothetical protein GCM10010259_00890 [Streptomyces daghestanicus]GHI35071.1 hypothetical protein Sdagh_68010 [Streptomyces daghestanicus]
MAPETTQHAIDRPERYPPGTGENRTALKEGGPGTRRDGPRAWPVEDLPGGRVRVLTQESRYGGPAAGPVGRTPNPMPDGHQARPDGLIRAARGQVAG